MPRGQTATQSDEDGKHHIVVWLWRHVAVAEAILETAVILEAAVVLKTAIVLIAVVVTITVIILLIRLLWLIVLIHN